MKKWKVYFSDYPEDPMKCRAASLAEARKIGNRYRRLWNLPATIIRIEEDKEATQ